MKQVVITYFLCFGEFYDLRDEQETREGDEVCHATKISCQNRTSGGTHLSSLFLQNN